MHSKILMLLLISCTLNFLCIQQDVSAKMYTQSLSNGDENTGTQYKENTDIYFDKPDNTDTGEVENKNTTYNTQPVNMIQYANPYVYPVYQKQIIMYQGYPYCRYYNYGINNRPGFNYGSGISINIFGNGGHNQKPGYKPQGKPPEKPMIPGNRPEIGNNQKPPPPPFSGNRPHYGQSKPGQKPSF